MTGRTLQVTLPAELDAEVAAAVSRGEYASAEDAVAGAVAEWGARRGREASLDAAELGSLWRDGIESGAGRNLSADEIKREGRRRLASN
jgi:Arc/MetJ-type ribon-helix-helix transcriptional regulator